LASAGIEFELREVDLRNKPAELLALSSKATVPVLQLPDQRVLDESLDIMLWALASKDPKHWLNCHPDETQALIQHNDGEFKQQLDAYKYHVHHPRESQAELRQKGEPFLQKLEDCLIRNDGKGLLSNRLTLADIALLPFLRQFANVDRNWFDNSTYTHIQLWLEHFENSREFQRVMEKT